MAFVSSNHHLKDFSNADRPVRRPDMKQSHNKPGGVFLRSSVECASLLKAELSHGGRRLRNTPHDQVPLLEVAIVTHVEPTATVQRLTRGLHTFLKECSVSKAARGWLFTHFCSVYQSNITQYRGSKLIPPGSHILTL